MYMPGEIIINDGVMLFTNVLSNVCLKKKKSRILTNIDFV